MLLDVVYIEQHFVHRNFFRSYTHLFLKKTFFSKETYKKYKII